MDVERFTKLMMLTTSDQDGEALSALRMANKMLRASGKNWEAFIAGKKDDTRALHLENARLRNELVTLRDEVMRLQSRVAPPPSSDGPTISHMLSHCQRHVKGSAADFIDSLADAYEKWGRLTPRQYAALNKFYRNCA